MQSQTLMIKIWKIQPERIISQTISSEKTLVLLEYTTLTSTKKATEAMTEATGTTPVYDPQPRADPLSSRPAPRVVLPCSAASTHLLHEVCSFSYTFTSSAWSFTPSHLLHEAWCCGQPATRWAAACAGVEDLGVGVEALSTAVLTLSSSGSCLPVARIATKLPVKFARFRFQRKKTEQHLLLSFHLCASLKLGETRSTKG